LPEDFLKVLPEAVKALDHPSIDGLNAYVVSMATKNAGITVALSGVGGDEWFAGYPVFHSIYHDKYVWIKRIPQFLRILMVNAINFIKKDVSLERKMEWLKSDMGPIDLYKATKQLFSQRQLKQLLKKPMSSNDKVMPIHSLSDLSVLEWNKYLMPVLLRDTDQMGMAHALEIREPFMDYQMIEYVLSLPDHYKIGAKPKQLLVDAMGDLLPDEIVSRKKMGFVLPYEKWMKTELKPFVLEGIAMLKQKNVLNNSSVDFYVESYFQNKHNVRWNMIWSLTILGHWLQNNDIHHD
jgi:asparagine synthase (glutamine-hydrolysing)